jgi:hypothetical protein
MAVSFYFRPTGFSRETYDETVKELEAAGLPLGSVAGLTFHCAMEVDGSISVFDVWDSTEQFDEFGKTLLPIMNKLGADPGQPMIANVHNLQHG